MIKLLTFLGIIIVVISGSLSVLSTPGAADDASTHDAPVPATGTVAATPPAPEASATPEPVPNRLNCDQIRGTDYHSPDERTWYLANCVTR